MPIFVSGNTFEPHPEGQFRAVCVDVVEKRDVPGQYGPQTKIRIAFQTEDQRADGKPNLASATFGASLGEKSRLRPFLEAWRGKKFTTEEVRKFDVEALVGAQAVIQITHVEKDGKVYDNITAIMRPMRGMEPLVPRDYVRVAERQETVAASAAAGGDTADRSFEEMPDALNGDEHDDLPF